MTLRNLNLSSHLREGVVNWVLDSKVLGRLLPVSSCRGRAGAAPHRPQLADAPAANPPSAVPFRDRVFPGVRGLFPG